jgi:hypothetical protein
LHSAALTALPEILRWELLDALVTLDTARIDALIERVAEWDIAISQYFRWCADNFDYDLIEAVLRGESQGRTALKTVEKMKGSQSASDFRLGGDPLA